MRPDNKLGASAPTAKVRAPAVGSKLVLDDLPETSIHDRLMLAGIDIALMRDLAPVQPVLQDQVQDAARERLTAGEPTTGALATLAAHAAPASSACSSVTEPSSA